MARLVLLHGFTQTGRSFDPLLPALAEAGFDDPCAPDLPGHGPAPVAPAGLEAAADHAAAAGGRATYLGYSLGGRVALHLALARPGLVERLVLVSTTAGLDDPAERAARRADDEALARSLEAEGLDAFLDRWLAQPLLAGLPAGAAGLDARRQNTAAGLAAALRGLGLGTQAALWDRLSELAMPVLVTAGERDHRYCRLASRLVAAVGPNANLRIVPGAGHACHLERPAAFVTALSRNERAETAR